MPNPFKFQSSVLTTATHLAANLPTSSENSLTSDYSNTSLTSTLSSLPHPSLCTAFQPVSSLSNTRIDRLNQQIAQNRLPLFVHYRISNVIRSTTAPNFQSPSRAKLTFLVSLSNLTKSASLRNAPANFIALKLRNRLASNNTLVLFKTLMTYHQCLRASSHSFFNIVSAERHLFHKPRYSHQQTHPQVTPLVRSYAAYIFQWLSMKTAFAYPLTDATSASNMFDACTVPALINMLPVVMYSVRCALDVVSHCSALKQTASAALKMIAFDVAIFWETICAAIIRLALHYSTLSMADCEQAVMIGEHFCILNERIKHNSKKGKLLWHWQPATNIKNAEQLLRPMRQYFEQQNTPPISWQTQASDELQSANKLQQNSSWRNGRSKRKRSSMSNWGAKTDSRSQKVRELNAALRYEELQVRVRPKMGKTVTFAVHDLGCREWGNNSDGGNDDSEKSRWEVVSTDEDVSKIAEARETEGGKCVGEGVLFALGGTYEGENEVVDKAESGKHRGKGIMKQEGGQKKWRLACDEWCSDEANSMGRKKKGEWIEKWGDENLEENKLHALNKSEGSKENRGMMEESTNVIHSVRFAEAVGGI